MNLIFNSIESLDESDRLIAPLQKVFEDKCDFFCLIRFYNELFKYQAYKKSTATLTCYKKTQDIRSVSNLFEGKYKSTQINLQSLKFLGRLIKAEKLETQEESFTYTFLNTSENMIALMYKLAEEKNVNNFLNIFQKEIEEKVNISDIYFQKYYKEYDEAHTIYAEEANKKEIKLLYLNLSNILNKEESVKEIRIDFEKSLVLNHNKIEDISVLLNGEYKKYKIDMPMHFALANALDSVGQALEPDSVENMKMYCVIPNTSQGWTKFDEKVAQHLYPEFKTICFENHLDRQLDIKPNTHHKNKI